MGFFDNLEKALKNVDFDEVGRKIGDACERKQKELADDYKRRLHTYSDNQLRSLWNQYGDEDNLKSELIRKEMVRRGLL